MTDLRLPTTEGHGARRTVPFLDLASVHTQVRVDLDDAFRDALDRSDFIGGATVERFERNWAEYCGTEHAVGVANGTDAIELVLRALGIGPGDEVIVPTNTFIATAEAVIAVGAMPRLVDVDPGTLLLNADILSAAIGPRTAAVIPVHLYGEVAPMTELAAVARTAGLAIIEDAAQAHGARWGGQRTGGLGDAACFSFYPGKNLGALGDGGAVTTNDAVLADRVRSLGNHGRAVGGHYGHPLLGRNSRLDALQAAFLDVKLPHLDGWNERRRRLAARYDRALATIPGVRRPEVDDRSWGVHHLFCIEVEDRDALRDGLTERGVATGIHYPVPCHRQPALAELGGDRCPVAERTADRLLSLPMSPFLDDADVDWVCGSLVDALTELGGPR